MIPPMRGHLALVAVQVCYGLLPLFILRATPTFEPLAIVVWRIGFGALVLTGLAAWRNPGQLLPPRADVPRILLCGLLGVILNQALAVSGMARTTSVNAGLLMPLIPVFAFGLAILARQEAFVPSRFAGLVCALVGAILLLLVRQGAPDLAAQHLSGNLMIAVNCLSFSGYLVLSRSLVRRFPALVVTAWVYLVGVLAIPLLARGVELVPAGATAEAWGAVANILVFPTLTAYVLNAYALKRVGASTTSIYVLLQPVIAGLVGAAFLHEEIDRHHGLSAVFLFVGIWLVARPRAILRRS